MKIESRGKYPGVKVHLEPSECETFLALYKDSKTIGAGNKGTYFGLAVTLGEEINSLLQDHPTVLKPRSDEEIAEALKKEASAAALKLRRLEVNQFMEKMIETLRGVKQQIMGLPILQYLDPSSVQANNVVTILTTIDTLIAEAESKIKSWNKEAQEKGTAK